MPFSGAFSSGFSSGFAIGSGAPVFDTTLVGVLDLIDTTPHLWAVDTLPHMATVLPPPELHAPDTGPRLALLHA